jgi:2-amino-4-hydroxy-6-hydroxymethyldihydropteridine diphosphokinase
MHRPVLTVLMNREIAYIGLGSNLQQPLMQVQRALQALQTVPESELIKHSPLYRSTPLSGNEQPDYINAVAMLHTSLMPLALLDALQAIEQQQGRIRTAERWASRSLDLDMLLYADYRSDDPHLTLPHPELYNRAFVLYPLYDCHPDLILPNGQALAQLLQTCSAAGLSRIS